MEETSPTVPPPPEASAILAEEVRATALAQAAERVERAVLEVLEEAARQGVELPDGFAARTARAVARRCGAEPGRVGSEGTDGGAPERAQRPEIRRVYA